MTYHQHDRALAALQGIGPELRNGAPNHAPMVIEAMAVLGYEFEALHWIERHRVTFAIEPATDMALSGDLSTLLGSERNTASWRMVFRREMTRSSWREVLERWLPLLLPGAMATGTHSIIRCGHAVRVLREQETEARLDELAGALAYCAGRYRKIFGKPSLQGDRDLADALRSLPLLPVQIDRSGPPPKIVKALDAEPAFAKAVSQLSPPADPLAGLDALSEMGARLYLQNASKYPLVLLHGVTVPAAVRLLIADQSMKLCQLAFAYAWQAVAAWAAAYGTGVFTAVSDPTVMSWDQLVHAAIISGDDHAIKLTEACRRVDATWPSHVFQAVATDWMRRLGEAQDWPSQKLVDCGIRTRA